MGKMKINSVVTELIEDVRRDERAELGRKLERDGIDKFVAELVGNIVAGKLWKRHVEEIADTAGANPKPFEEDTGWWCNVAKQYLPEDRTCGHPTVDGTGCGWARKPAPKAAPPKPLAGLFQRRWHCGLQSAGYPGDVCAPDDPHMPAWCCAWLWEAPALTDPEAATYGLKEEW